MYPNPQDVLPLPPRASAAMCRRLAADLLRAYSADRAAPIASGGTASGDTASGDTASGVTEATMVMTWSRGWVEALWRAQPDRLRAAYGGLTSDAERERAARQVAKYAVERLARARTTHRKGARDQAQLVIARAHGFAGWTQMLRHVDALADERSAPMRFEQAADAIVVGDRAMLERLLTDAPALVHARSDRAHGATLLHYVSANGVENFRQRTPHNIVGIATLLLDRGADVGATCDVYGGGADTLGLVITSAHPRAAGVQILLADLLMARGARVGRDVVRDALANGCPEAASHMASRCLELGISLDVPELSGIGRADLLEAALQDRPRAPSELGAALSMAAWYGEMEAVRVLVRHGARVDEPNEDGATALHVASYAGQADLVDELLALAADVHLTDARYGTTPLVWALQAWLVDLRAPVAPYHRIVVALLAAGAGVQPHWVDDDRVRAVPAVQAALLQRTEALPTQ